MDERSPLFTKLKMQYVSIIEKQLDEVNKSASKLDRSLGQLLTSHHEVASANRIWKSWYTK